MMKLCIPFCLLWVMCSSLPLGEGEKENCGYNACNNYEPNALNVHIIPHSHDDVGWLNNIDEYYFNSVEYILTSTVASLLDNPNRRYIQVEVAFLKKWWVQQNEEMKDNFRMLVREGRLEIVNGGWVMNDEAAVHYQSTIDQYTLGLHFLDDILGNCSHTKIGWQIDPFGHSREHASLQAQLGFDGLFLVRIDRADKDTRKLNKTLDFMWEASANLGSSGTIFTSIFHDHYNAPNGYCFSQGCSDEPIVEDEESPYYNYEMLINNFTTRYACPIAEHYPTNNILIPMGDDFRYEAAYSTFLNLDKLISGFKKFPQYCGNKLLNVFYSTPTCYTKAVNDYVNTNDITLSRKTDDFFPYVGGVTDYWTGYYTSRPTSKRFARQGSQFLQVTNQLAAAVNANYDDERISSLREAVGNMQHHDAITGTEQQAVMKSYHRILSKSFAKAVNASNEALSILVSGNASSLDFNICILSNVTSCDETSGNTYTVLIYNPLSRVASPHVQLPVNGENWMITGPDGESVEYAMSKPIRDFSYMNDIKISSDILLLKATNIPALGFKIYQIEKEQSKSTMTKKVSGSKYGSDDTFVELDNYGLLANITIRGISLPVKQEFLYYNSSYENGQVSGAYVFRPNSTNTTTIANGNVRVDVTNSSNVYEVRQVFSSWITQIIRIYTDENFIELDWAVGPIPRKGIEVISRFSTPLKTNSKFYTDSNGREMIERIRDYRNGYPYTNQEPVSANYYPVTSRIVLKDDESNLEFAVLNERAQGGSSLRDGEIEIMVHRRCVSDDGFGVGEPLDEQEYDQPLIARGQHYLTVGNIVDETKTSAAVQRDIAQKKSFEPWVFATSQPNPDLKVKQLSILNRDLPVNVQLLTLELWNMNTVLIRFEHVMEKNEDPKLSANVTLDIKDLFKTFVVEDIQETTLSGTVLESDNKRLQWPGISNQTKRTSRDPNDFEITLEPMQIRTFLAKIDYNVSA